MAANLFTGAINYVVFGGVMMLFANDVLGLSPTRIGGILAFFPLVGLARFALLERIRRLGKARTVANGGLVSLAAVVFLLAVPARYLTFPFYVAILLIYYMASDLSLGIAWQPLLRDITSHEDRGRFFARMRFIFSLVTVLVTALVPMLVGKEIAEWQYKALLAFPIVGLANRIFWVRKIPELKPQATAERGGPRPAARLLHVIRTSALMRAPLLVAILLLLPAFSVYPIYLKRIMHVPSDIVSVYLFAGTLGSALSLLVWGKVSDTIGFRPTLVGLIVLSVLLIPTQLFLAPLPEDLGGWADLDAQGVGTVALLCLLAFIGGAMAAGSGIAITSIQHFHVRSEDSLEAMSLFQVAFMAASALCSLFAGFWLEGVAIPIGDKAFADDLLHFDWVKGYFLSVGIAAQIIAIMALRRLPNTRPQFGLADFFTSLSPISMRYMLGQRLVYHEDEDRRTETAEWFGVRRSPMALDPLMQMLSDPTYDVKVAAIRSLARTGSPVAGQRLLEILDDRQKSQIGDHVAWALGVLRYGPAFDALVRLLDLSHPPRVRAMAARALGKIGDARAVEPLLEVLRREGENQHEISSVCCALVRLGADGHDEELFDALDRLTEQEPRYEFMNALCGQLGISNQWLLRYLQDISAYEALEAFIVRCTPTWQTKHAELRAAYENRDLETIRRFFREQADLTDPAAAGLLASLTRADAWKPVAVLATAWLVHHRA